MQKRLGKLERELLSELSTGDQLLGFLCSAGSTYRMSAIARERAKARYQRSKQLERVIENLKKKGLVRIVQTTQGSSVCLTKQGTTHAAREEVIRIMRTRKHGKKTPWDGQWRMVAFDIPMKMSGFRSDLRRLLATCGFEKVQQSLYVYPHSCPELQNYLSQRKELRGYVHLFTGKYNGDDSGLKKLFVLD